MYLEFASPIRLHAVTILNHTRMLAVVPATKYLPTTLRSIRILPRPPALNESTMMLSESLNTLLELPLNRVRYRTT
jgi:hypothetical protein